MASENANVVDELVVRLTLDAESYQKAQEKVNQQADGTEQQEKNKEGKRKTRERDQSSRMKGLTSTAKSLGSALAAVAGFVVAVGAAVVGSLANLNQFEVGLRRQGVATGLSNRELQAWGSTARRLGADADAGAAAIADLAREQKNFNKTGDAPTLQALARIGVNASPTTPIQDVLASAQQVYRNAPTAQKGEIESVLSSSGVNSDLIVMIKSETDVREAFTKSLQQATAENTKALDAFNDAVAAAKDNALSIANSLATVLQPGIEASAKWFSTLATDASRFSERIVAAGGGVDGFMKVLNEESPTASKALRGLADVVDVVAFGLKKLKEVVDGLVNPGGFGDRFNKRVETEVSKTDHNPFWGILAGAQTFGKRIAGTAKGVWDDTVDNAHDEGIDTLHQALPTPATPGPTATPGGGSGTQQAVMGQLVSKYGLSVADAAALTANLDAESGLRPNAYNPAGGGQGARGLAQFRGGRIDAFRKRYGMNPDAATIDQQLEFIMTDPYERGLLDRALAGAPNVNAAGAGVSRTFEAHGDPQEDARRGVVAGQLAAAYSSRMTYLNGQPGAAGSPGVAGAAAGNGVTISGPVSVYANNPQELANGLQRISGVQNQNSAVR